MTLSLHHCLAKKAVQGTAIVEYGIVSALLGMALIFSISTTGIQNLISPWFQSTVNSSDAAVRSYGTMNITNATSLIALVGGLPLPSSSNAPSGNPITPPPNMGEEQVCFNGGLCINVPVISSTNMVETSATTGAWAIHFSSVIEQVAQYINIVPGQEPLSRALTELTLKGYNIGYAIKTLPEAGLIDGRDGYYTGVDLSGKQLLNDLLSVNELLNDFMRQVEYVNHILSLDPSWQQSNPELVNIIHQEARNIRQLVQGIELIPQNGPTQTTPPTDLSPRITINSLSGILTTNPAETGPTQVNVNVDVAGIDTSLNSICGTAGSCTRVAATNQRTSSVSQNYVQAKAVSTTASQSIPYSLNRSLSVPL